MSVTVFCSVSKEKLGPLDASLNVKLVRWKPERFLECSAEMLLAQSSKSSQRR
jgi:hypothetical protein